MNFIKLLIISTIFLVFSSSTFAQEDSVSNNLTSNNLQLGIDQKATVLVVRGDNLNVRDGAGISSSILGELPFGTEVTIIGGPQHAEGYVWWQVETPNGITGWAVESADGLQTLNPSIELTSFDFLASELVVNEGLIVFVNDGALWMILPSGIGLTRIPLADTLNQDTGAYRGDYPRFSPNGRYLAYVRQGNGQNDLMVLDLVTRKSKVVVAGHRSDGFDWSPDSTSIAYEHQDGIKVVNIETGLDTLRIPSPPDLPLVDPQWSPDGTYLAFRVGVYFESVGRFATARASGEDGTQFMIWNDVSDAPGGRLVGDFDWHPESSQLVFDNNYHIPIDTTALFIANADSSAQKLILGPGQIIPASPVWSPDGSKIAFVDWGQGTKRTPWILDTTDEGANLPQQVSHIDVYWPITWSPDSRRLLITDPEGTMHIVPVDGSESTRLAHGYRGTWQKPRVSLADVLPTLPGWSTGPEGNLFIQALNTGLEVRSAPSAAVSVIGYLTDEHYYRLLEATGVNLTGWGFVAGPDFTGWISLDENIQVFMRELATKCGVGWDPEPDDQVPGMVWITATEYEELHTYYRETEKAALTQVASTVWYHEMYEEVRLELTLKFFQQFLERTAKTIGSGINLVLSAKDYAFPSVYDARLTYIAARDLRLQLELHNYPPYRCGDYVQVPIGLVDGGLLPNISNPFTSLSKYLTWDALLLCEADRTTCDELFGSGE